MEAIGASSGSGDALNRARELRANLGVRRDAETLLAEASKVRQEAAATADALLEEAQRISAEVLAESRREAERFKADAREHAAAMIGRAQIEADEASAAARVSADQIRDQARIDAEEHRARVAADLRVEVTAEVTSRIEEALRALSGSLDAAATDIGELLSSLAQMRSGSERTVTSGQQDEPVRQTREHLVEAVAVSAVSAVDSADAPAPSDDLAPEEPIESGARPKTATEAFLSSSALEVQQSDRELRDLRAADEERRRRNEDARRAAQHREPGEGLGTDAEPGDTENTRPLGWLFRSAQ